MRLKSSPKRATRVKLALLATATALVASTAAQAETDQGLAILGAAGLIASNSCERIVAETSPLYARNIPFKDAEWRVVPTKYVAFFTVSLSGEIVEPAEALSRFRSLGKAQSIGPQTEGRSTQDNIHLRNLIYSFQKDLAAEKFGAMRAFTQDGKLFVPSAEDANRAWIADSNIVLGCKLPTESAPGIVVVDPNKGGKLDLRLRGDVAALAATDKDRVTATAASFGYSRTRTFQEDGSRTQASEFSVKAVLGAVLDHNPLHTFVVYGGYELKQNRVKPAPTLVPPATERDGDTDIITLGSSVGRLVPIGSKGNPFDASLNLRFDGTYKFDLVKDSERAEGKVSASLFVLKPIAGICTIGGLNDFGNGFWAGCELSALASYNVITRHGLLPVTVKDHFAHAGGKAAITLYRGDPGEDTAFASAQILYMPRIDGDRTAFPDIKQHKFSLGYRWWKGSSFALEAKGELTDGINPDSFADENALTIGFGVIF
jgi:hypothetical protein